MSAPNELFQVLLVENEEKLRDAGVAHLGADFDVHPIAAASQEEAERLLDDHYFDAAIVDIELRQGDADGIEVIRKIIETSPTTQIVVGTRYQDRERVGPLLTFTAEPQLVEVIFKQSAPDGWQRSCLDNAIEAWRNSRIAFDGTAEIVKVLRAGGRVPRLRRNEHEVQREIDRLLHELFATLAPVDDKSNAAVEFIAMRSSGLSSAAVFEAIPRIGRETGSGAVPGIECVVKVGAREEIEEEARRYDNFVRFGAHLSQRVEMLSFAFEHSLGAICYSIVGARDASVLALDDALREADHDATVLKVLEHLFSEENRSWYSVSVAPRAVMPYFNSTYSKTMVEDGYKHLDESLSTLANRCQSIEEYRPASESSDGSLRLGGVKLAIPHRDLFGAQAFIASGPACLIHGDMHGGNVLMELAPENELERVCLIDYRYSGPGPRCVDFAALDVSARYADADAIAAATVADPQNRTEVELDAALQEAARRQEQELALGMTLWNRTLGSRKVSNRQLGHDWQVLASEIHHWAGENFSDLTLNEYVATGIAAGIRQMSYDLEEVRRLRLLAWISAQYQLLTKSIPSDPGTDV